MEKKFVAVHSSLDAHFYPNDNSFMYDMIASQSTPVWMLTSMVKGLLGIEPFVVAVHSSLDAHFYLPKKRA